MKRLFLALCLLVVLLFTTNAMATDFEPLLELKLAEQENGYLTEDQWSQYSSSFPYPAMTETVVVVKIDGTEYNRDIPGDDILSLGNNTLVYYSNDRYGHLQARLIAPGIIIDFRVYEPMADYTGGYGWGNDPIRLTIADAVNVAMVHTSGVSTETFYRGPVQLTQLLKGMYPDFVKKCQILSAQAYWPMGFDISTFEMKVCQLPFQKIAQAEVGHVADSYIMKGRGWTGAELFSPLKSGQGQIKVNGLFELGDKVFTMIKTKNRPNQSFFQELDLAARDKNSFANLYDWGPRYKFSFSLDREQDSCESAIEGIEKAIATASATRNHLDLRVCRRDWLSLYYYRSQMGFKWSWKLKRLEKKYVKLLYDLYIENHMNNRAQELKNSMVDNN